MISDKLVAVVGVLLCIALVVPLFMVGSMVMFLLPAVLTTVLCMAWMLVRRTDYDVEARLSSKRVQLASAALFFALLAFAIVSIQLREDVYERPPVFFLAASLMSGVLTLEILFSEKRNSPFILAQIFVLAILLSWSMLVLFPNIIGIDPWWHRMFTTQVLDTGYVPERYGYTGIPLFHIFNGASAILGGVDYKAASMFVVIVGQLVCEVLLVFLIARQAFHAHKIALLAALAATFTGMSVHMAYEPTPTTMAFTFVLLVLFLVLRKDRMTLRISGLMAFLAVTVILTHTVTAVCLLIALLIGAIIVRLRWTAPSTAPRFTSVAFVLFVLVGMVGWWFYASGLLPPFRDLLEFGFNRDYFGTGTLPVPTIPAIETTLKWAGMMIAFSISIIGLLHAISPKGNIRAIYVSASGMIFLALGIMALTLHLGLLEDRWWYYASIVLAAPLGAAIYILSNRIHKRTRRRAAQVVVAVGVSALTLLSILSPLANIDNPLIFPNSGIRYAYTESELNGASFSVSNLEGIIASDSDFTTNPSSSVFIDHFSVSENRLVDTDASIVAGNMTKDDTVKLVRTVLYERPLRLTGQVYNLNYDLNGMLASSDMDKIYANGGVNVYS